jgi:hypothetical protein
MARACGTDASGRPILRAMSSAFGEPRAGIHRGLVNLLGRPGSDFLDVHAAFRTGHQHDALGAAVGHHAHIVFLADVRALLDQEATHALPAGAGLMGDQLHVEDRVGVVTHFVERARHLDSAALPAAARVDLGLDHPHRPAQLAPCLHRIVDTETWDAARCGHAVLSQDLFGLVFVDLHLCSIGRCVQEATGRPI